MSGDTVTGRDISTGASIKVTLAGDTITAIAPNSHDDDDAPWLAAGLVDLQVNGFHGHDFNADGLLPETVTAIAGAMLRVGVTRFVPTLITNSEPAIIANLQAIAAARRSSAWLRAMIPFVHVEGPHISSEEGPRGAHPATWVRPPDLEEFARWQEASNGLVGMVTLSPHYATAPSYIAALASRGVHVAIGHSDASPEQIRMAAAAGAVLSTHLGNGVSSRLPRHPNLLWTQLADDRLTATFIADGHHLAPDTFRAMIRAKGIDRAILVSDVVAVAGLPAGEYRTPVGGQVTLEESGRLNLTGTPFLAGAALPLKDCIAVAVDSAGISLTEALRMASANPARFAGGGGELAVGQRADLIRFHFKPGDRKLIIDDVWLAGQTAMHRDEIDNIP